MAGGAGDGQGIAISQHGPAASERAPIAAATPKPGAIPSLDGLRVLAVLIVVASHSGYGETIPGGLGVTIFFFLSGYLITTLILDEQRRRNRIGVGQFYARRALRLLPPLFVTLAIAYSLVAMGLLGGGTSWRGLSSQLFYFANYFQIYFADAESQPNGTGILWSLAVEEHFYILFPLVVFSHFATVGHATPCLRCSCRSSSWRLRGGSGSYRMMPGNCARTTPPTLVSIRSCSAACWQFGATRRGIGIELPRTRMKWTDWLLLTAGGALLLVTIVYRDAAFRESGRYTLQGLALMPVFYYAIRYPTTGPFRILNTRVLARIGVLSYGIYLLHDVLIHLIDQNIDVTLPPPVRFATAVGLSVALATLLDRHVDPYFRRKRAALH